jgi:hypothetical protein
VEIANLISVHPGTHVCLYAIWRCDFRFYIGGKSLVALTLLQHVEPSAATVPSKAIPDSPPLRCHRRRNPVPPTPPHLPRYDLAPSHRSSSPSPISLLFQNPFVHSQDYLHHGHLHHLPPPTLINKLLDVLLISGMFTPAVSRKQT